MCIINIFYDFHFEAIFTINFLIIKYLDYFYGLRNTILTAMRIFRKKFAKI